MTNTDLLTGLLDARILFLGPPGSGKGTQCKKLKAEFGLPHLSTGDLLRRGIEERQAKCLEAQKYIDTGNLVPDELMISIFKERLSQPDCHHGFILDGFPRTLPQAKNLDEMLKGLNVALSCVFYLKVTDELIIERLTGRFSCSQPHCGAVYHIKYAPPKVAGICDICGGVLKQRTDDKPEVVPERLKAYKESTAPLIDYYTKQRLLVTINGARGQEEIYADIVQNIRALSKTGGR